MTAVGLQERFHVGGAAGPLLMVVALFMAWPVSRWLATGGRAGTFGLAWRRSTILVIGGGLAAMVLARLAAGWIAIGAGIATFDSAGSGDPLAGFVLALAMGAIPALAEDVLTRGFPLFAARSTWPAAALIALSAAMYALNHVWRLDWGITEQQRLFCMGLAYAAAAWRARSLWAAFALHLGWNAGSALVPLDISGTEAFRIETAILHLILAAAVMLLPPRLVGASECNRDA
ncbi:MAG TPA: CPBP family glutamic-type intramembrane protease [Sphingomicrobium sp.]|nr:CPBP family glutamic-type intramembrane protease [Sphingomicrobium sp.]